MTIIQVYALTSNVEEAELEQFSEGLQDLVELTPQKDVLFHYGGLECKSRNSRNIWSIQENLALEYRMKWDKGE